MAYYNPLNGNPLPPGFDASLYPDGLERVPRHVAIVRANRLALSLCEYLICYDTGKVGNTRQLVALARRREQYGLLKIVNLA